MHFLAVGASLNNNANNSELSTEETVELEEFTHHLKQHLKQILSDRFSYGTIEGFWISDDVLLDAVYNANRALRDWRHHYSGNVTVLKYVSNVVFWISNLKPIYPAGLTKKGQRCEHKSINEELALMWAVATIRSDIEEGNLQEVISAKEENIHIFDMLIKRYVNDNIYRKTTIEEHDEVCTKYEETIHHLRYKKFTAINLYEILMHLIVPFQYMKSEKDNT